MSPNHRLVVLVVLVAVAVAHGALFGWWVVDDAAISFAYARNWADGHGLVPYPGGERVEGYSNFAWMALLALGELAGLDAWWGAKILSFLFAGATVPLMARLGARTVPAHPTTAGLAAAALYATFAQTGIFTAAGLENPLFTFLLALGLLWGDEEACQLGATSRAPLPRSAVVWLLLAITRPEGIVYAAAAGAWALLAAFRARAGARWIGQWLLVFFAPLLAYHAVRYAYFAWPFPMTYYAKVQVGPEILLAWRGPGWGYLQAFWSNGAMGWFAPAALIGAIGLEPSGRAVRVAALVLAAGALVLLPDAALGPWFLQARAAGLWAIALVALACSARAEPSIRGPAWTSLLLTSLFAVHAMGDWMGGFRWMSLAAAPLCLLLAAGIVDLAQAFLAEYRRLAAGAVVAAVVAFAAVNAPATFEFLRNPEISPDTVRGRADYFEHLAQRLQLDERPRVLTYDLGGFLWWSDLASLDAMGLVDVAVARNKAHLEEAFQTYLFEEARPHFIAMPVPLVDALSRASPRFLASYVPMSPDSSVRRDLLFEEAWRGPGAVSVGFGETAEIAGFLLSRNAVEAGGTLGVDVGLRMHAPVPGTTLRLLLRDTAGAILATWPVPPAYGWADTATWTPGEVFHGRYVIRLPAELPPDALSFGIQVLVGNRPSATGDGEHTAWLGDVRLGTATEIEGETETRRTEAITLALDGRCDEARQAARGEARHPVLGRALGACWLATAERDPALRVAALLQAREADATTPGFAARLEEGANERWQAGLNARSAGDDAGALRAFTDAVALTPHRSWARRSAEEARARLIDDGED